MQIELRNICFVRHAKSSWTDPSLSDHDRPLNNRGKRDAPFMASKMKELGVVPDFILCSTAKRARQTARYFIDTFKLDEDQVRYEEGIYEASASGVISLVRTIPDDRRSVFVFGHNPTFTFIANMFAGIHIDNVPTCGICQAKTMIDTWSKFDPGTSAFVAFYYPKLYL